MATRAFLLVCVMIMSAGATDPDYSAYEKLLAGAVSQGGVAYEAIAADTRVLEEAKKSFEAVTASRFSAFPPQGQIAFLVNVYNLYTLDLIVRNLPGIKGIRDIAAPWDKKIIPLFGKKVSLNHVEHDLLRKKYTEPRIHFALVCASRSCPELLAAVFTPSTLDSLLDHAAALFLKDPSKNRIDGKTLYLSQIFEWYGGDFKATHAGGYREYVGGVLGIKASEYSVKFLPYDWSLNRPIDKKNY